MEMQEPAPSPVSQAGQISVLVYPAPIPCGTRTHAWHTGLISVHGVLTTSVIVTGFRGWSTEPSRILDLPEDVQIAVKDGNGSTIRRFVQATKTRGPNRSLIISATDVDSLQRGNYDVAIESGVLGMHYLQQFAVTRPLDDKFVGQVLPRTRYTLDIAD